MKKVVRNETPLAHKLRLFLQLKSLGPTFQPKARKRKEQFFVELERALKQ